ncbi:MAG: hypothetical protein AB8G99_02915, partial [Planctomycetaceae bacterium]
MDRIVQMCVPIVVCSRPIGLGWVALLLVAATVAEAQLVNPPPTPPGAPRLQRQPDSVRDSVDSRAPENRQVSVVLGRVRQQMQRGQWAQAIQQLQSILDQPQDGLVRLGPGRFVSMRTAANDLLKEMPAKWRERYVQQFGALAERTLKDAIAKADYSAVGDVATRYRQTDAGVEAARAIALRHLDRGEYSLALRWLGTVDGRDSSVQMLQTAVAQKLTGSDVRDTLPE